MYCLQNTVIMIKKRSRHLQINLAFSQPVIK